MRVLPILFNTEMVQAILEGKKTVTRRVLKPQPQPPCELRKVTEGRYAGEIHLYSDKPLLDAPNHSPWGVQFVPPFQPGDILYVRETWRLFNPFGDFKYYNRKACLQYFSDLRSAYRKITPEMEKYLGNRWHPSIHMPKEFARIFLRVTEVRVERLQEITDHGARQEGCGDPDVVYYNGALECEFADLWDSTIKPADLDNYGWAANPWVWVISFERCEKPEAWP